MRYFLNNVHFLKCTYKVHILQLWEFITIGTTLYILSAYTITSTPVQISKTVLTWAGVAISIEGLSLYTTTGILLLLPFYDMTHLCTSALHEHQLDLHITIRCTTCREDFNHISFCFHIRNNLSQNYLNPPLRCSTQYSEISVWS